MSSMKIIMADQEKDVLARALEPLAWMLNLWAPRRETPVITGRIIVAVAVTVEMGSEKARILYRMMLQSISLVQYDVGNLSGRTRR